MIGMSEARKKELDRIDWSRERTQMISQWINDVEKLTPESDQRILGAMLWRLQFASTPLGNYVGGSGIAHEIHMNLKEWARIEKNLLSMPCHLSQAQAGLNEWMALEKAIEGADLSALRAVNRIENVIGEKYTLVQRADSDHWLRGEDYIYLYVDLVTQTYQWSTKNEEGDVIAWVMRRNLWTFQQAVAWLMQRAKAKVE